MGEGKILVDWWWNEITQVNDVVVRLGLFLVFVFQMKKCRNRFFLFSSLSSSNILDDY